MVSEDIRYFGEDTRMVFCLESDVIPAADGFDVQQVGIGVSVGPDVQCLEFSLRVAYRH